MHDPASAPRPPEPLLPPAGRRTLALVVVWTLVLLLLIIAFVPGPSPQFLGVGP